MIRVKILRTQSQSPNKLESPSCVSCKKAIQEGEDSFECVWCEKIQHRTCLQISSDQYSALSDISSNILFFCSLCLSRLPSALSAYDGFNDACSTVEKSIKSVETLLSNKFDSLTDQMKDLLQTSSDIKTSQTEVQDLRESLSAKIVDLCSQNETFQERLQQASSEMDVTSGVSDATGAFGVVDEIADRERRRRNIIVYNLPEKPDRVADRAKFIEMCKEITDAELKIAKFFRLGKRVENKHRPA